MRAGGGSMYFLKTIPDPLADWKGRWAVLHPKASDGRQVPHEQFRQWNAQSLTNRAGDSGKRDGARCASNRVRRMSAAQALSPFQIAPGSPAIRKVSWAPPARSRHVRLGARCGRESGRRTDHSENKAHRRVPSQLRFTQPWTLRLRPVSPQWVRRSRLTGTGGENLVQHTQ